MPGQDPVGGFAYGLSPCATAWWHSLDPGLVAEAGIHAGPVSLRQPASRNDAVLIEHPGTAGVFLKRGPRASAEARAIRDLADRVADPAILPRIVPDGSEGLVLVAEAGEIDLWALHTSGPETSSDLGAATGRALAVLHETPSPSWVLPEVPDVTSLHRPRPADLSGMTPATLELIRLVQATPALTAGLDTMKSEWTAEAVIHGDVKWTNMLAVPGRAAPVVRLIDWESVAVGDPAWDLGSALASYLSFWLGSIRPPDEGAAGPGGLAAAAERPLDSVRPAMRAVWDGYHSARTGFLRDPGAFLARTTLCCAGCLVRAAMNEAAQRATLSAHAMLHLQVAANVMADPATAADRLLGLHA